MNYSEFITRTPAQVVLAIFDKMGLKLNPVNIHYDYRDEK